MYLKPAPTKDIHHIHRICIRYNNLYISINKEIYKEREKVYWCFSCLWCISAPVLRFKRKTRCVFGVFDFKLKNIVIL